MADKGIEMQESKTSNNVKPRQKKQRKPKVVTDLHKVVIKNESRTNNLNIFPEYIDIENAKKIIATQDPINPTHVEGKFQIDRYNYAYISMPDGKSDLLISGIYNRNRAMEGDLVLAAVIDTTKTCYKNGSETVKKFGRVICILEMNHPRTAVGCLLMKSKKVFLKPRDSRLPSIKVVPTSVPPDYHSNSDLYANTLFFVTKITWNIPKYANGTIQKMLGKKDVLNIEVEAILLENGLDVTPFSDSLLNNLPSVDFIPSLEDLVGREDFRQTCVVTINPVKTNNSDNAISCVPQGNGNFLICVHISDVSHFLEQSSPLDEVVSKRAATTYLVDNLCHMLPEQLCDICSLKPGVDKLAFSVIMEITSSAEVVQHRFAKSVINSCCQLSYKQIQRMIEYRFVRWSRLIVGDFKPIEVLEMVRNLYNLSNKLHAQRYKNGPLMIEEPKLVIELNNNVPISTKETFRIGEKKECHRLVEEFMILVNTIVAKQIYKSFPDSALLRSRAEPSSQKLLQTQELLDRFGVVLNNESIVALQNSLARYQSNTVNDSREIRSAKKARIQLINRLYSKSMMQAEYRCSSLSNEDANLGYYAPNGSLYTHFTSPIRSYADIVVHRLLNASMQGTSQSPWWTVNNCALIARTCNIKKFYLENAEAQIKHLYYMRLKHNSYLTEAIVMSVKENSIDVLLCNNGMEMTLYYDEMKQMDLFLKYCVEHFVPAVKIFWPSMDMIQVINTFSMIFVKLEKHSKMNCITGTLIPPELGRARRSASLLQSKFSV